MTNDNDAVPNPELREYVTGGAFVLTMSKLHIAMLVAVAHNNEAVIHAMRASVTTGHGLKRRGLLMHCGDVYGRQHYRTKYFPDGRNIDLFQVQAHNIWRLTKAGWAVYDLLEQAGLAPAIDKRSGLRKRIAA